MTNELLQELSHQLSGNIAGDIRLDATSRQLYSTDASIYQIEPLGVVFPRVEEDLAAIVATAAEFGVPVLPRGSGSSLAGQTVGAALVVDCSRHLNQILEIDPEQGAAWVQPGVVLNYFNRVAGQQGYKYGPDPASADRATFGGMLGNNSTGAHSILYGMSSDNALAMEVVLADGSQATLDSISQAEAGQRAEREGLEGRLYQAALALRQDYAEAIQDRWPRVWRKASGYSLNYLLPWSPSQPPLWGEYNQEPYPPVAAESINLAPVFVGSEGTLALTRRAKIRIVRKPPMTALGVLSYDSVAAACDAAPELLELLPTSVELIPQAMIHLARGVPAYADQLGFVHGDPAALLIVEFSGSSQSELDAKLKLLGPQAVLARSTADQEQIWSVRKVGLGLLMSRTGDAKPLPFIEDVAVPVEELGDFVRGLERIFAEHGTVGDFYAHASAGCLHVRPLVNLKTLQGIRQMRAITEDVVALANRFGGAMSGEHGDGLARGEWLEATFGPELMQAFRTLKQAADPQGILNPGKVIDAPPMDESLRYGAEYQAQPWQPLLSFEGQGGLAGAIEMCNGAGVCRKEGGVMCPSFQASREEMHSTRGRANLLRALISTGMPADGDAQRAVQQALDLCLECKGCKSECPSGVDVAKLKYEFLHHHYESHRRPVRDYLFAYIGSLGKLGQTLAPLSNWVVGNGFSKRLGEGLFGLSAKRGLPKFKPASQRSAEQADPDVLFLRDAFTEFFYPEVIEAAFRLLEAAGLHYRVLPVMGAGRSFISKGFLDQARAQAQRVLEAVQTLDPEGCLPVIGVEPSELYTLRDEYLDLLPDDPTAKALAERAYMLDEFFLRPAAGGRRPVDALMDKLVPADEPVLLHGHCYQKAQPPAADGYPSGDAATATLLSELGFAVEEVESGCCGMAGSFGYEAEHYELSMQIGELALFPAVRAAEGRQVAAAGVSCRSQIASGTGRQARHPLLLVADLLK